MIIVDENVERYWIELLRSASYPVISVSEVLPQITDRQVVELTKQHKGILITEDKDFGELIFAHHIQNLSVIFLRYDQPLYEQIEQSVMDTVARYYKSEARFFITITRKKIRVREL